MQAKFFGDDPLEAGSDLDSLERDRFADQLVEVIQQVREQTESSVLAIIGPWGSGKSSILNMVVGKLRPGPWAIAHFNPWIYSDQESLQNGFFAELRAAMEDEAWSESRKAVGALGRAVAPLGKLTMLAGVPDVSAIVTKVSDVIAGDTSVTKTKAAAEAALRKAGRPVLVVMDDLDRLTPDELLLALKLVRLVGRLPNVYYLLSYDEKTLVDVLEKTPLASGGGTERARSYLEKIVQVRLDLPVLRDYQRGELVNARFADLLAALGLLGKVEMSRVSRAYHDHLASRLNTPRTINRFFAQVAALYKASHSDELDFVDFFLVTWVRTAEPALYFALANWKGDLTGPSGRSLLERLAAGSPPSRDQQKTEWLARLARNGVAEENLQGVLAVLAQLFAPISEVVHGGVKASGDYSDIARRRGIGHQDYFDRYFAFGVPSEDLADAEVVAGVAEMASGQFGDATSRLVQRMAEDPMKVLRKIELVMPEGNPPSGLVGFLAATYPTAPDNGSFDSAKRNIVDLLKRFLAKASRDDFFFALSVLQSVPEGLSLLSQGLAAVRGNEDSGPPIDWFSEATAEVIGKLEHTFSDREYDNPERISYEDVKSLWSWALLDAPSRLGWLRQQVESQRWHVVDILAAVQQGTGVYTDSGLVPVVGEVRKSHIEDFLGLDFVMERAFPLPDGVQVQSHDMHETEPTFEHRREAVAAALEEEARRRSDPGQAGSVPLPVSGG